MKHFVTRLRSKRLREAAGRLTDGIFDYHRVGCDHRPMTFRTDGTVGEGARKQEVFWHLNIRSAEPVLEISSNDDVTCRLKEGGDHVWRGQWLQFERMPVEISRIARPKTQTLHKLHESWPESLFVVALPRSLSTIIYHSVRRAIGLHEPAWTTDGEILNLDRFVLFQGPHHDFNKKFISLNSGLRLFYAATEFLDQMVAPRGFAYKDVVQPFVVADWAKRRGVRVIRIKRNIADVAYSMLNCRWFYPSQQFPEIKDPNVALVRGLLRAEEAIGSIPAQILDFEGVVFDERMLNTALRTLYPGRRIIPVSFIDVHFKQMRQQILARRRTGKYKMLAEYVQRYSARNTPSA